MIYELPSKYHTSYLDSSPSPPHARRLPYPYAMGKRSREDSPPSSTASTPSCAISEPDPNPSPNPNTEPHHHHSSPTSLDIPVHSPKYLHISDYPSRTTDAVMKCSLPPHREILAFSTFEDFEIHYAKEHANRCSECRKNFPTNHFLELHIGENHDPLSEARRARGEKTVRVQVSAGKTIAHH